MRPLLKIAIVLVGYAAALAIAAAVEAMYVASTSGPDRQTYVGMFAFGDAILYLMVFAVAAVPATAIAFFFLRKQPMFWNALAVLAVIAAMTSLVAGFAYVLPPFARAGWLGLAPLRIFAAPPLALLFLIAGVFAPTRTTRLIFAGAIAAEVMAFVYVTFMWMHPLGSTFG